MTKQPSSAIIFKQDVIQPSTQSPTLSGMPSIADDCGSVLLSACCTSNKSYKQVGYYCVIVRLNDIA